MTGDMRSIQPRSRIHWFFDTKMSFKKGMEETVRWYLEHKPWWERIKSGEYLAYYEKMYKNR